MAFLHIAPYQGLAWLPPVDVLLVLLLLEGAYLYGVTELRPRISDAGRVKRSQVFLFSLGVLALYAGAGSPVHDLADERLVSMHMLQHVLFMLVAPPLLLLGTPDWLLRPLLRSPGAMALARLITRPLVALALSNAVLLLAHLPVAMDVVLRYEAAHLAQHAALVAAGLLLWWPVLSPLPELPRSSYPIQMLYLFVQSLLPTVMASFLTFSDRVVYGFYADAPRVWGLSPVADQQIAGLTMKLLGGLILWTAIAVAFFRWYSREEAEAAAPIKWAEVEAELTQVGLIGPAPQREEAAPPADLRWEEVERELKKLGLIRPWNESTATDS